MNSKMKRVLSMILCVMLCVSLLAACNKADNTDTQDKNQDSAQTNVGTEENDDNGDSGETDADEPYFPRPEKEEVSVWSFFMNNYVEDPNELASIKALEEQTNVHAVWNTVSWTTAQEKFGLMIASGEMPDLIAYADVFYAGGMVKGVEDGVFLDLTDMIPEYMPNYQSLRTSQPVLEKDTKTDDGRLVGIYTLNSRNAEIEAEMCWKGMMIRQDLLDELGLSVPETLDQWHDTLVAFRDAGIEAPLMLDKTGVSDSGCFLTAFGVYPEFYQEDGVVKFYAEEEGYKEYLALMSQWFAEGLIDKNFVVNGSDAVELLGTGKAGAGCGIWNYTADYYKTSGYTTEDIYFEAVVNPVMNAGDTSETSFTTVLAGTPTIVSSSCEDPELAMRWFDQMYTKEFCISDSYGIEGETYVLNEDGTYEYTDAIMNNPDGYTPMDAIGFYAMGHGNFTLYNWGRFDALYVGNKSYAAEAVWDQQSTAKAFPKSASLTTEESIEYASYYTDITTMINEYSVNVILGTDSLDNWDNFIQGLKNAQLDRCKEIKQNSLDRYNNR